MRKRRRFTPEFKAKVVLEVLAGTQSPAEACRKHALRARHEINAANQHPIAML
jgi:transposase-like protein